MLATKPFQMNSMLVEVQGTFIGRQLMKIVNRMAVKMLGESSDDSKAMVEAIISDMPLRNLVATSQGKFSTSLMRRLIHCMNHDWRKVIVGSAVKSE
jgi:phospholipid N-methyltransferase